MWTIDIGIMGVSAWLPTAGRYGTADDAVFVMGSLPNRDCYGRWRVYRARPCTADELARRAA